jgi:hypothetical protein
MRVEETVRTYLIPFPKHRLVTAKVSCRKRIFSSRQILQQVVVELRFFERDVGLTGLMRSGRLTSDEGSSCSRAEGDGRR